MLRVRVARVTIAVMLGLAAVSAAYGRSCDDWMCGTNGTALNGSTLQESSMQGSTLQGARTHGTPGETIVISSAGLVRVELPR